jgi:Peptidase family C25
MLASLPAAACSGRVHVEIGESGVYALDYAAIVAAQPELKDCRAADLALFNRDREVSIRVIDDSRGGFGPGARIEWLGQRLHGPQSWFDQYSNVNVYQLGATPGAHARLRELDAAPAGATAALGRRLHFEQENLLIRLGGDEMKAGDEPDVWQWAKLTPIDAQPFTFDFDLPDAELGRSAPLEFTLDFRGESNVAASPHATKPADHVVEVSINDKVVQTLTWEGRAELVRNLEVTPGLLHAQHNRLGLRVPRRDLAGDKFIVDVVMFNWMEVAYPMHGDLGASTAAFHTAGSGPIELRTTSAAAPELFGSDGTVRHAIVETSGRFRAAGADSSVELYPLPAAGPAQPLVVRAVAEHDLRAADPGYDYLIVAHPRLLQAIEPLARYHREHGLKVAVIDVDDLYDQFGGGVVHPRAIRDFVAFGREHWQVKPRYLLLVGDASFDIHHDLRSNRPTANQYALRPQPLQPEMLMPGGLSGMGTTPYRQWDPDLAHRNLIPTWQMPSAEGQFASDNGFVALTPGDIHPQLAVGRLPVIEPADVKAIIDKTIAYLEHPASGAWRHDVTFVSTSELAAFKHDSDAMAAELRSEGFAVTSLYTDFNEKNSARYALARQSLKQNLDAGNLLVHFLGHGGQFIWRVGPIGDLFSLEDVSALRNADRYPMVLAMTCFSAPFDHPTDDSIGELFLREPDKGAVAVFAASWSNWPNPAYSKPLIDNLLTPGLSIGDAIVKTKAHIDDHIFVEMYNLLGDPAVVLARPRGELHIARAGDAWDARVIAHVPAAEFGGNVDVDWIDAHGEVIASRRYEARDAQFQLSIPEGAARVAMFATDTRDGSAAIGSLDLREKPAAPPPASKPSVAPVVRKPKAAVDAHDRIGEGDFE